MKYKLEIIFKTNMEKHTEQIREYLEDTFGVEIIEINQGEEQESQEANELNEHFGVTER